MYGGGFTALDKEPTVFQVPDFGDRFWVYPLYDTRTDEIARIGKQYGSKPGFYMIVGRNWKGEVPAGITAVVRSSTDLVFAIPRIQMDDTAEDRKAIQPTAKPSHDVSPEPVRRKDEDHGLEQNSVRPDACRSAQPSG